MTSPDTDARSLDWPAAPRFPAAKMPKYRYGRHISKVRKVLTGYFIPAREQSGVVIAIPPFPGLKAGRFGPVLQGPPVAGPRVKVEKS